MQEIVSEISIVVNKAIGTDKARSLLQDYLRMLKRHHLMDENLEELAGQIWAKHSEALDFLMERRPDILSDVITGLKRDSPNLAQSLSDKTQFKIVEEIHSNSIIRFSIENWDSIAPELDLDAWHNIRRTLLVEIRGLRSAGILNIQFVIGPNEAMVRNEIGDTLRQAGINVPKNISNKWCSINSEKLFKVDAKKQYDSKDVIEEIKSGIIKYFEKHIRLYNNALRKLGLD